jgi:hypothetical protein
MEQPATEAARQTLARHLAPIRDAAKEEFDAPDIQDGIRLLEAKQADVGVARTGQEWEALIEAAGLDPVDPLEAVFAK